MTRKLAFLILGIVTAVFSPIFVSAEEVEFQQLVRGMIVADNVRVREEPNGDSKILAEIKWGELVRIYSIKNDWAKIYYTVGYDEVKGWVYSAYFDPCHKHFKIIEPYINKEILKYKTCIQPTKEEKEKLKVFIKEFGTACEEDNYEYFKKHTTKIIYFNDENFPEPNTYLLPVGKYSYEHGKVGCFGLKASDQKCVDLPKSSYCDVPEVTDYIDENDFIILEAKDDSMLQTGKYNYGDCAVTYGNDWMNIWGYYNQEELYCGTDREYYFRKIDSVWKLTRVDIFMPD